MSFQMKTRFSEDVKQQGVSGLSTHRDLPDDLIAIFSLTVFADTLFRDLKRLNFETGFLHFKEIGSGATSKNKKLPLF